ncbi:hypothetical protein HYU12_03295 [Candidatus Woesearchaeota archaeon]|nr:hypothetical protein [Candidatus Woesearchaeota archaeon]
MKKRTTAAITISILILLFTLTKTKNRLAITLIWLALFAAGTAAFAYVYRKKMFNKTTKAPESRRNEINKKITEETKKTITGQQQPQQPKTEQKPQQTGQKHKISAEKFRQIKEKHDRMSREEVLEKLRKHTRGT